MRRSSMKKILPIELNTAIKAYTTHAFHLSIAAAHKDFMPWFCSNYIQLMSFKDFTYSPFVPINFYLGTIAWDFNLYRSMPLVERQVVTRTTLRDIFRKNIIELLKESIQADCYVYLHVNDYYIEGRPNWQGTHEILVYGYDDERQTVEAVSHFGQFYSSRSISYADFQQAYYSLEPEAKFQSIYMLSVSPHAFSRLDMRFLQHELNAFLNADTVKVEAEFGRLRNPRDVQVFGQRCYAYIRANTQHIMGDVRPFHLLWEHKNCMLTRLAYLKEKGLIDERDQAALSKGFNAIGEQLLAVRNMQLKNMVVPKQGLQDVMIRTLHEVEEREAELMRDMIKAIAPATMTFGQYVKLKLDTTDLTVYDLSRKSGMPADNLLQLMNADKLPWEIEQPQLKRLAEALSIRPALLEQLLINYSLDPLLRSKLTDRDEIQVTQSIVDYERSRQSWMQELVDNASVTPV